MTLDRVTEHFGSVEVDVGRRFEGLEDLYPRVVFGPRWYSVSKATRPGLLIGISWELVLPVLLAASDGLLGMVCRRMVIGFAVRLRFGVGA